MGKKVTPSGYYIINLDCSDIVASGTPLTLNKGVSKDIDILYELAEQTGIKKPILLQLNNALGFTYIGFPTIEINESSGNIFLSILADTSDGYISGKLEYLKEDDEWTLTIEEI